MIARSRLVFAAVLVASSALHLAAMTLLWTAPSVEIEGGAPVAETSFGSSFSDLAEGVQQPAKTVQNISQPPAPDQVALSPAAQVPQAAIPPAPTTSPNVATVAPAPNITELVKSQTVLAAVQQPATPVRPDTQPAQPNMTVAALPETSATPVSVRPRMPVKRPEPAKVTPAPKPAKPKGNANRNAKAGTQSGNAAKSAQPRQNSQTVTRKAQGNAAASNYPGQVMRRISRVPRPRTSARGVAVIQFLIAANGSLSSAGIAGSSGSAALDQAALAVVRKAQPFPPPPSGARRSYSIKIKGR